MPSGAFERYAYFPCRVGRSDFPSHLPFAALFKFESFDEAAHVAHPVKDRRSLVRSTVRRTDGLMPATAAQSPQSRCTDDPTNRVLAE